MSALSIEPTYPTFTDSDGSPLDDGYVWIGAAGSGDPIGNPQTAYWDAALTQVVTQPVRTRGGYPNECELPDGTTEEFLGLSDGALIPLLVASIKELKAQNDALSARVAALEAA